MKLYIIYKVSKSGWDKEMIAIFQSEDKAELFKANQPKATQYDYVLERTETKD